ncbi:hypothetical protein FRC96_12515 [Lujinxingia vulgaris]|uniref:Uncharacterized protein n=1 Tax=Lujinxingia vulgaris TaxID=2600176 RepID=A0A5C6X816_9DELT|nr:hypothetical protein [Lujinxingia vulgaris]TXD34877.1 hypothetical protein FRC96_12515 [Lujinxingia vulgaris]
MKKQHNFVATAMALLGLTAFLWPVDAAHADCNISNIQHWEVQLSSVTVDGVVQSDNTGYTHSAFHLEAINPHPEAPSGTFHFFARDNNNSNAYSVFEGTYDF